MATTHRERQRERTEKYIRGEKNTRKGREGKKHGTTPGKKNTRDPNHKIDSP